MMNFQMKICLGAAFVFALVGSSVVAGTITHPLDFPPGAPPIVSGPGLGLASVPVISTNSIDNDNQPGGPGLDNNIDVNLKRFDSNDYIDIEFTVRPSNGTTEYRVVEFVDNNTGIPWTGYRLQLGFGVGAAFAPAAGAFGLDFDAPLFDLTPTASSMLITSMSPDELVFSGAHGPGAQQYNFRIDVPNLPAPIGTFTLRQSPIPIPEPGTLALLTAALMGIAVFKRNR
jgi:hypothetical protein